MSTPDPTRPPLMGHILDAVRARFSLREDRADDQEIDTSLRAGVTMQGTNLWVLMFAIFIASIGLNVNSTAVIIGAMLISPMMGPILGVGYGAGIHDFPLIRRGIKNWGIAAGIALLTSTVYFALTPLGGETSEMLSRTTPTIWDVLIALFGGLAGIIGATRRQKSNVIPGVAIATALMPPLCTAGYALANGRWGYFFGALYLFTINSVFIAASATLVTRAFHLERRRFDDPRVQKRVALYMATAMMATLLPSLYLAYRMVGDEIFRTRATAFVRDRLEFAGTHVNNIDIDPRERRIYVSLIGDPIKPAVRDDIIARMPASGLPNAKLQIYQAGDQELDVATLRSSLLGDLYKESQEKLSQKEDQLQALRDELASVRTAQDQYQEIPAELHALFPEVTSVLVFEAPEWDVTNGPSTDKTLAMNIKVSQPLSDAQRERIESWLRTRFNIQKVLLTVERS
jgi:uncharacterized hydrophobic protein (TIGR00271 family)